MKPASHIGYLLLAVSLASATSCNLDIAQPVSTNGGGSSAIDAIIESGANCAAVAAVGESSCPRKRASSGLECAWGETCILYGESVLLCLEAGTGMLLRNLSYEVADS